MYSKFLSSCSLNEIPCLSSVNLATLYESVLFTLKTLSSDLY